MAGPRASFGIFVRNGARYIARTVESVLAQEFDDIECVICDNASDDRTIEICRAYAERDPRVRLVPSERNIGQIRNFNRVFDATRGEFLRWLGCDDWVEPSYAGACVAALDRHPEAVAATTYQSFLDDEGRVHYHEFDGERLDSPRVDRRFARWLWMLHHLDLLAVDPLCGLIRRRALARTPLLRLVPSMDAILVADLLMHGTFHHIPECLAHRRMATVPHRERYERWRPERPGSVRASYLRTGSILAGIACRAPMGAAEKASCLAALGAYLGRGLRRRSGQRLRAVLERSAVTRGLARSLVHGLREARRAAGLARAGSKT